MALVAEGGVIALGLPVFGQYYGEAPPGALRVDVTGRQFFWASHYAGPDGRAGAHPAGAHHAPRTLSGLDPDGNEQRRRSRRAQRARGPPRPGHPGDPALHRRDPQLLPARLPGEAGRDAGHGHPRPGSIPRRRATTRSPAPSICGLGHYRMRGQVHVLGPRPTRPSGDDEQPRPNQESPWPTRDAHGSHATRPPSSGVRLQQGPQGHRHPVLRDGHAHGPGGAGTLAMLIRLQLAWPEKRTGRGLGRLLPNGFSDGVMNPEFYAMLFTMHGTIMVFFVLSTRPVSGFGNFLIPLQIGRPRHGLPVPERAVLLDLPARLPDRSSASFFVEGGAAAGGWTSYPPLSALRDAMPGSRLGADPVDRGHGLLHRVLHHGRPQLRDHHPEPAHQGPVPDAHAPHPLGHVPGGDPGPAGLPAP